jgi:WD40 repeat protein
MKTTRQDIEAKIRIGGTSPERAYALSRAEWTSMEFNESGKQILVGTVGGVALTLDGYEGTVHHSYQAETAVGHNTTGASSKALPMAACFTRDGLSVMCGNDDGTISCYQADTGLLVRKIRGHPDRVGAIAANPKYKQFASACTNTAVWIW